MDTAKLVNLYTSAPEADFLDFVRAYASYRFACYIDVAAGKRSHRKRASCNR